MTTTLNPPTLTDEQGSDLSPYEAIRTAAAVIDYSGAGLFELTGRGAGALVSQVSTRSVDFLLEGQSQQALVLDDDGRIVSDVVVHGLGDGFLLQVWPDQAPAVRSRLQAAVADPEAEATLTDASTTKFLIGVEGPTSFGLVGDYVDFPISSLAYQSSTATTWRGHDLLVGRTGVTGEYGYSIVGPVEVAAELIADLVERGAALATRPAVDVCRMEMRFPNLEAEIPSGGATPFDLGLQWMVDFDNEFVGKDALLAAGERTTLPVCWQGPVGDRTVPAPGTPVDVSDATVGSVLHAVYSPTLDRSVGTALVQSGCAAAGLCFTIGTGDGGTEVESVSAPFLIATSFTTSMD
jgi:aminomethyltransferase